MFALMEGSVFMKKMTGNTPGLSSEAGKRAYVFSEPPHTTSS